jgi:hypothetical protein
MSIPLLAAEPLALVPVPAPAPLVAPVPLAPEVPGAPLVDPEPGLVPVDALDPEPEFIGFAGLLAHAAKRPSRIVETGLAIRETKRVMMTSVQRWSGESQLGARASACPKKLARLP